MKHLKKITLLLLAAILLTACNGTKNENKISLIYVNWAEGIAMTNVAKILLEENGYEVDMKNADVAPIFASLSRGNADVFMDVWLPITLKEYMDRYSESLEVLGVNFNDARIGLVVPSYVTINSIDELDGVKDKFKGEIVGIDAGAGIMKATESAIVEYDMDLKLLTASEAAMTASLKRAIDNNQWIVVTGWTPHWKFSRFDLKMLEDPKGIYGEAEQIKTIARKGFSEEQPYAAELFSKISFTSNQIGSLIQTIEDEGNEVAGAQKWIDTNRELTNSWLPETVK